MAEMVITGQQQLRDLGLRLKAGADTGLLRRELLKGIRAAAGPLVADVRQAARERLPKGGGLNEWVADSPIAVRTRLTGVSAGVRIVNTSKVPDGKRGGTADFGSDRGKVRHPVFGHKDRWAVTNVEPGWFSKTLEEKAPQVTPEVVAAMERTSRALTGRSLNSPSILRPRS